MSRPDLALVRLRPCPDIVSRDIAGEHLLVPVRRGAAQMDCIFTANEVGSLIFRLLDGRRDAAAIARLVSQQFQVDQERAHADVLEYLAALYDAGLVRAAGEEPS